MSAELSETTSVTGTSGIVFSAGPYTNAEFAALLIQAYQSNYEIRVPNFEIVFQNNIPSVDMLPPIISTSSEYTAEVEAIVADLPMGYLAEIFTGPINEINPLTNVEQVVSNITYQNTENGWVLQPSEMFNAYISTTVSGEAQIENED